MLFRDSHEVLCCAQVHTNKHAPILDMNQTFEWTNMLQEAEQINVKPSSVIYCNIGWTARIEEPWRDAKAYFKLLQRSVHISTESTVNVLYRNINYITLYSRVLEEKRAFKSLGQKTLSCLNWWVFYSRYCPRSLNVSFSANTAT